MDKHSTIQVKSAGHIAFVNGCEYFARGGEVFRAPESAPIMLNGCRCGRWESSVSHFIRFASIFGIDPTAVPV